ncbi:DNA-binding phage protein [Sphingobium jiangsuense]|uniref:DNA-binding phage protein n=1 Tax=Sphingobium jiangsuense TaxID=870476 RepID=A0A7W6BVT4_9SPHN|nr:hypothetical protein [Sphingobium jiangsuense]MBB3928824.1 DNA-binding phage protein [Sphingobium jiangsuense]
MPIETRPWDIFEYLTSEEEIQFCLEAAEEDGTPEVIARAREVAGEARRHLVEKGLGSE